MPDTPVYCGVATVWALFREGSKAPQVLSNPRSSEQARRAAFGAARVRVIRRCLAPREDPVHEWSEESETVGEINPHPFGGPNGDQKAVRCPKSQPEGPDGLWVKCYPDCTCNGSGFVTAPCCDWETGEGAHESPHDYDAGGLPLTEGART